MMRVLFIAPQPFFVERGTPIAVRHAVEAICAGGHEVDLLTLPGERDVQIPGMRLLLVRPPRWLGTPPIGFSPQKLVCDLWLAAALVQQLRQRQYDVVHAVEESVFLALAARPFRSFKLIYDMDSILSGQIVEKWPAVRWLGPLLRVFERAAIRRSHLVLPVCEAIAEVARRHTSPARVHLLPDPAEENSAEADEAEDLRSTCGIQGPLALYVGNLEPYQGMSLLLQGLAKTPAQQRCSLVVIGGRPADIGRYRAESAHLGLEDRVHFVGARPLARLSGYLAQADILCSPRLKGVNTPMKIYSYMASGKSILATRLPTHTQVLDDQTAMLVENTPEAVAAGFAALIADAGLRERLGRAGQQRVLEAYSRPVFRKRLLAAYDTLGDAVAPAGAGQALPRVAKPSG